MVIRRKKKNDHKGQKVRKAATFKLCSETKEKIWIRTVTLGDIKHAEKTGETPNGNKKHLVRIPSKITRENCYSNAARALEYRESRILPTYGGRPWRIFCRINEPKNSHQKPPLFRWFNGELELAVLPHLLAKVPEEAAIEQKGKAKLEEVEEEDDEESSVTKLSLRDESQLSRVAWRDFDHQIPSFTTKWQSPNQKYFYSRKAVGEHALTLLEQQLLIDKIIFGIGARGQALRPSQLTKSDALKAGKFRFLRDGLWIVGQEESWQTERAKEVEVKRQETEETKKKRVAVVKKPSKPKTPFQLFLRNQRVHYRKSRFNEISLNTEGKVSFVVGDADRELKVIWKDMKKEEKQIWKHLLEGKGITEEERKFWQDRIDGKEAASSINNTKESSAELRHESNKFAEVPLISPLDTQGQVVKGKEVARSINYAKESSSAEDPLISPLDTQGQVVKKEGTGVDIYVREMSDSRQERGEREKEGIPINKDEADTQELILKNWECLDQESKRKWEDRAISERGIETAKYAIVSPADSEGDSDDAKAEPQKITNGKRARQVEVQNEPRRSKRTRRIKRPFDEEMDFLAEQANEKKRRPSKWIIPIEEIDTNDDTENIASEDENPKSKSHSKPLSKVKNARFLQWRLSPARIQLCYDAAIEHFEKVMVTVKARGLVSELNDGFDLLRERGRGRYDMELPVFDEPQFSFLTDLQKAPWMEVVRQALGEDVILIHKGVFLSNPGASSQNYHQDGPHLTTSYQRPCHAINVFIPLVDLTRRNGPTEFVLGSHILGFDGYDREKIVTPNVTAGTPIIFDYRLGHRGLSNTSDSSRPIVYCTYAVGTNGKEFRDIANFSRKRYHRLGTLLDKPLSRDERLRLRKNAQNNRQCVNGEE